MARPPTIGVILAVLLFALMSWNSGHHWDEYFYLYSSFMHSPRELLRYELASGLFPPGFFTEKIGHVVLLRFLTEGLGGGERVLYGIECGYFLLLLGYVGASYRLLRELFGRSEARVSTLVLMFSPVTMYLGYKLLSEVPSLLFVSLACWCFVLSFTTPALHVRRTARIFATPLLALAALFRVTAVVQFAALGIALFVAGDSRFPRKQLLKSLTSTSVAAGVLYVLCLQWLGGDVLRIISGVDTVATTHPPLERLFAVGCFVQSFALVLPFAWSHRRETQVGVAVVWLICAAFPFLAGHEPRYYAPALIPLAVLTATGIRAVSTKLSRSNPGYISLALLTLLVLINRALFIPLMPYEVEQEQLLALFHQLNRLTPGATYLLPWMSDYALLRFSSPGSRIELCLSVLPGTRLSRAGYAGDLAAADRWWAGDNHYIGSRKELLRLPRPWTYIGWTYNPAFTELLRELSRLGAVPPPSAKLHNHLTGSWIWGDRSLSLRQAGRSGLYQVFVVTAARQGARATAIRWALTPSRQGSASNARAVQSRSLRRRGSSSRAVTSDRSQPGPSRP